MNNTTRAAIAHALLLPGLAFRECDPITGEHGGLPSCDVDCRFHHVE